MNNLTKGPAAWHDWGLRLPVDQAAVPHRLMALQIGECLRCLRHVIAGRLPMSVALPTLPALDRLLHQLAGAAGQDLHRQLHHQHQVAAGGGGGRNPAQQVGSIVNVAAGAPVPPPKLTGAAAGIVPFTAASMGTARTVSC